MLSSVESIEPLAGGARTDAAASSAGISLSQPCAQ
jgi:hypothetical protein